MPVVNLNFEQFDVRIDRRSPWGNKFIIGKDGDRAKVIADHRNWLWKKIRKDEIDLVALAGLDGKRLGCHCAPLDCHGDTLERAARWAAGVISRFQARTGKTTGQLSYSQLEDSDLSA